MAITTEQWDEVKKRLESWETQFFLVDGYYVSAHLRQIKMKLVIAVYVNGMISGRWLFFGGDDFSSMSEIAKKFYCLRCKSIYSQKQIKALEKACGKTRAKKMGIYGKTYFTDFYFSTAKAFINHLKKHNDSIEILSKSAYDQAISGMIIGDVLDKTGIATLERLPEHSSFDCSTYSQLRTNGLEPWISEVCDVG